MKSQLSPFDQALKNIWQLLLENPNIPKRKMDALLIHFGNLTFKSKLSKKERDENPLYTFDFTKYDR